VVRIVRGSHYFPDHCYCRPNSHSVGSNTYHNTLAILPQCFQSCFTFSRIDKHKKRKNLEKLHLCVLCIYVSQYLPDTYMYSMYIFILQTLSPISLYMLTTNTYVLSSYSAWIRLLAILADILFPQCLPPTCPCTTYSILLCLNLRECAIVNHIHF
jgi:hypothetical protein